MIVAQSAATLQGSFNDVWFTVVQFVPAIIAAAVIFVIGWIVGMILAKVIEQVVDVLRIDDALKASGVSEAVKDAGFHLSAGKLLGGLVKWFVILVFLIASLEVLGLVRVTIFLQQVVLMYLPQVIVAVLIIILAAVVAEVVKNIVIGSARAAGVHQANLAGAVAKWAIWIFAILAALNQLGVAAAFWQTLFTGIVVALSLAFGLAFGLGGKEAAARTIEKLRSEMTHDR
ncbi:hypothetical protein A2765_02885 [Candidatus Kaiserbacteria bacterium RIFCSPHIGHO2_01_FULL_56_24]|uniref:Small-conductance mechanosensitive ion channel n=1 Tax=Candidatus Kaiserbacteria bacterium RIFCSPHIGHO2_01_FULL_56_24 TaxID=1798487 RepID=A0A1F6DB52_9BACT|nr:MAG: hypothetical protein A2765_02885 [Candidatus Kaiserbacteria bacterium RIFCSPHIGHO2_01_FULL_56_24]